MPKRDYVAMSGRQHKVLDEQAARYDLPLLGESVVLFALLKRFHDLFAEGRFRTDDDLDDETQQTPNLEKLRGEKYRLAKLDRLERQRQLLPRRLVRELLGFNAAKLRNLGEQLQRRFGPEALDALNDTIDEIARARPAIAQIAGARAAIDAMVEAQRALSAWDSFAASSCS